MSLTDEYERTLYGMAKEMGSACLRYMTFHLGVSLMVIVSISVMAAKRISGVLKIATRSV